MRQGRNLETFIGCRTTSPTPIVAEGAEKQPQRTDSCREAGLRSECRHEDMHNEGTMPSYRKCRQKAAKGGA
eukprot:2009285-Pleurochrysis_carterae.AAC.1